MSDLKLFFRYITPSMLGMLIAGVYSIVDIFFVGIAVGEEGLAAISLAFPVVMLVYGIGDMIGTGAGILISRERGCGNAAEANRFFNRMLLMELLAGVLLPLLVIPWLGLILTGSGATPELLPGAYSYTAILLGAGVMQMVAMGLMTAIRNDGRPILAMWLVVVGLVGNIGLDALFMIGLGWGLVGAAVATVLAQGMAMLCSLGYFFTRYAGLGVRIREMRLSREYGRILSLGIPTFGNQLSIGAMLFFHNWQSLAYGGVVALAAYTVISTVESVGSMLMTGMGAGVQPLVSYFFGGGRCRRGHRIGNYGMVSAFLLGIVMMFASMVACRFVPWSMGLSGEAAEEAAHGILIWSSAFLLLGVVRVGSVYFQASGRIIPASILIYGDSFCILPLCLLVLPLFFGLNGVWAAMPASRIFLFGLLLFFLRRRREGNSMRVLNGC